MRSFDIYEMEKSQPICNNSGELASWADFHSFIVPKIKLLCYTGKNFIEVVEKRACKKEKKT